MKKLYSTIMMLAMMVAALSLTACGGDDEDDGGGNNAKSKEDLELETKLAGTSWRLYKGVYSGNNIGIDGEKGILTFTSKKDPQYEGEYICYVIDHFHDSYQVDDHQGSWSIRKQKLVIATWPNDNDKPSYLANFWYISPPGSTITKLSDTELILNVGDVYALYYKKTNYREANISNQNNNPSDNGGGSSGDAPRVIDFNFTPTKNSITVYFMATEKTQSATIYYGETTANNSLSTSIINKQISAKASGLKSGTKYYFKCKLSNSYGSSTSLFFPAMTNY